MRRSAEDGISPAVAPVIDDEETFLSRAALKWNNRILLALDEHPYRFLELKRTMKVATQRMLTRSLRSLQRDGFVERIVVPDTVLHVTYQITDMGRSVVELIRQNKGWISAHLAEITEAQEKFDAEQMDDDFF